MTNREITAFVAYRDPRESVADIDPLMKSICTNLGAVGVKAECSFLEEKNTEIMLPGVREKWDHELKVLDSKDFLFMVQASSVENEDTPWEVSYCRALRRPIVLAIHKNVQESRLVGLAVETIDYGQLSDLEAEIAKRDFAEITKRRL